MCAQAEFTPILTRTPAGPLSTSGLGPGLLSPHKRNFPLYQDLSTGPLYPGPEGLLHHQCCLYTAGVSPSSGISPPSLHSPHSVSIQKRTTLRNSVSTLTEEHSKYTPCKEGERSFYAEIICPANNNKGIEIFRKTILKHLGSDWTDTESETGTETD